MNKFRRQFAYEGQEDDSVFGNVAKIWVRGLVPPFSVDLFSEGYPPSSMRTWDGISYIQQRVSEIDRPRVHSMLLEDDSFVIDYFDPVVAKKEGDTIIISQYHKY